MHGGTIGVHSDGEGSGSTFFICMPAYFCSTSASELQGVIPTCGRGRSDANMSPVNRASSTTSESPADYIDTSSAPFLPLLSSDGRLSASVTPSDGQDERKAELEAFRSTEPAEAAFTIQSCVGPLGSAVRYPKALLVDDSDMNRRILRKSLESVFDVMDMAEDGEEAVQMVRQCLAAGSEPYDVVFMDFIMPKMDGPTAARALRDMGFKGRVIGVTGSALARDVRRFVDCGADMVMIKPVALHDLRRKLNELLDL